MPRTDDLQRQLASLIEQSDALLQRAADLQHANEEMTREPNVTAPDALPRTFTVTMRRR